MTKVTETKCELAMTGRVVEVENEKECREMTEYIIKALKKTLPETDIMEEVSKYSKNHVRYLVCNTVAGMPTITYLLDSEDEDIPKPFKEDYGTGTPCAFSYVLNLEVPHFSEFGDCFFLKETDGFYHRVA